ncbi:uncharacterized protein LOC123314577 isoform X2 [Coccinella septempunctata]|uniref:uncharacterized protein LOC123314577 isoform X2 n=1 Tax=Coccinella septempunctata TaxID=41139 RepID=UPI001D07AD8D|nr:uncharacterized protein LOC123314577 isoform X2 [Coccinella septempunctata]
MFNCESDFLDMEFWNSRNIFAPPTYTYEANADDIDIGHLKSILQDGIKFYNDQNLLNMETALLSRIVYRMKTKFRNSKDFHTFEKVKRSLTIYEEMDISKKLEYFLSILPSYDYHQVVVSLPTKNMIDYILVQLQGIGQILTKAIDTCKLTVIIYEHRLYLGHFWQLAIIAISIVSRIHVLCLNMVKYTCILYARLLPFSHKLKNVTTNWLPKEYTFPKDLKSWLNVEWSKLEEVIEVPDDEFNMSFIDIAGDSDDDDVEYIELSDVSDILEDFKKIRKTLGVKENIHQTLSLKHSFTSNEIDLGEEIRLSEEDEVCEAVMEANDETSDHKKGDVSDGTAENENGKKYISSEDEPVPTSGIPKQNIEDIDIGEVISSDDEIVDNQSVDPTPLSKEKKTKKNKKKGSSYAMVISSSEDEDSVQFVAESLETKKPFATTDFIPLGASTPFVGKKKNKKLKKGVVEGRIGVSKHRSSKNNIKDSRVVMIPDSPGKHGLVLL